MKQTPLSRRHFLQGTGAAVVLAGLPACQTVSPPATVATPVPRKLSANDRPGVALVGCGGMGTGDARNAANYGNVIAVCDVDATQAERAAKTLTVEGKAPPAIFSDFRRMLERDDVHVVVNGTPDHWHTLVNLGCARAGKDVYAEKPLTLTVDEGRRLVGAVRQNGIVLQTGTQQRSSVRFRQAAELIRNQRIGRLHTAHVWLPAGLRDGPFAASAAPKELNWNYWLGQAPRVDYVKERCHRTFRFWYDYSGGTMTDWGAHHVDIACWAIGLDYPLRVESRVHVPPIAGGYDAFSDYEINYTYANGVRLNVYTTRDDTIFGAKAKPDGQRNGIRFDGTEGWIWVNRDRIVASDPEILKAPLPANAVRLYESKNHMENFFDCVRSREAPICDVETGHRSASMCHLGAISLRTGRKLNWDGVAEKFVGEFAAEANTYLARELRKPYDYSFVA
jgi:predicted dehydrogenase